MTEWSQTWTFFDNAWHEGNPQLLGPRDHAAWLGSTVFDGARAFEGVTPDLEAHCQRVNDSATALGLIARRDTGEIIEIAKEGVARFDSGTALYIRPMYWAQDGGRFSVPPNPESTEFCMCIYALPMPEPAGFSVTRSSYRRPAVDQATVNAKAACLYPNSARALAEAAEKGFDNALVLDPSGHVAELATSNVFLAKDGEVHTPYPNGTFLNGVTRQRVIKLLEDAGTRVHQRSLSFEEFEEADEIFATGNYFKVMPVTRIEQRSLQPGPYYSRARELYWDWSHR
ncbi:MAG: branched-chain amino acid aminotransferase [Hyphomicrobiaceae bacterium]|nr:branched-chain amino acid aminotransferase [Hyphomicrobiaceae bacterium]